MTPQPVQTRCSAGDSDGPPLPERKELIFEVIFALWRAEAIRGTQQLLHGANEVSYLADVSCTYARTSPLDHDELRTVRPRGKRR